MAFIGHVNRSEMKKPPSFRMTATIVCVVSALDGGSRVARSQAVGVAVGEGIYDLVVEVIEFRRNRRLDAFVVHFA